LRYFNKNKIIYLDEMSNFVFTEITSPLDQFEIRNLLSIDAPILANLHISLTNIGLYLTIGTFLVLALNLLATNYNKVVSNS
jgi:F-type H+-transporting ATPase subunit a